MAPVRSLFRSCPLCFKVVVGFSQHLRQVHNVWNTERILLCNWQSGRVNIRQERCPVTGCSTHVSRLDRHMDSHTELNRAQRRQALEEVKRRLTMERLAALRASIPAIPLANDFDIVETARQEEEEDNFLDTFAEEEEEEGCTYDYCHAPLLRLQKAVKERDEALTKRSETIISIKEDNLKLISELHRVRKRYQLLKRQMGILRVSGKGEVGKEVPQLSGRGRHSPRGAAAGPSDRFRGPDRGGYSVRIWQHTYLPGLFH
ncbi:hypothetical protein J4Q44_G00369660 [Coregonus suidteri]|uniref:Uncharacterized protein n=1 Tax=Coregonus suidteri TaxID=861788 RepID=A0AAN8KH66_9TELE